MSGLQSMVSLLEGLSRGPECNWAPSVICGWLIRWIFALVVDFYNQINLLYGAITEFCSPQSCPEMKATDE